MKDFDVILGLDWLEEHYALIDYCRKCVIFRLPSEKEFSQPLIQTGSRKFVVSTMKVARLMSKGCSVFLAYVVASTEANQSSPLEKIRIVRDFPNIFPKDMSRLPPDREIEFSIDLLPRIVPISKAPYRMAPVELAELRV